ncbi:MATE family efflux transporter [uncultured Fusobacterium sp.]|uniref:MATE family efflux transporter n=1 Tax=uncultured Fusobacterium sp. TaxID=159267 RepID=UPI0027DE1D58|nr:MATE family efflux transporter [uncultured Fusobacterium sp.]
MEKNIVLKFFVKYVTLNVMGMIGFSCYILADTYFISKGMGVDGLTALNLAIPLYTFINGTGLMIGIGGGSRYAVLRAKRENDKADSIFTYSIQIGILIGLFFFIIGIFLGDKISYLLGADKITFKMTSTYLKTIMSFAPLFILNNIFLAFVRNDGDPKLAMGGMLLGSFSNIVLDYVFIFLLKLGMFGAAFATGLAPVISMCVLSLYLIKKRNQFHLKKEKLNISKVLELCGTGASSFITEISSGIVLIVFNAVILKLEGNIGVAAYGVVANLALVVIAIFTGIAQGVQPLVSKSYGSKDKEQLYYILRYSIILSIIVAISVYTAVFFSDTTLVSIFNKENNKKLFTLAVNGLHIYFTGFLFAGINIILSVFFSSMEHSKTGFIISITRGFVAIVPAVLVLSYIFGMTGVWLSFPIAEIFASFSVIYFINSNRNLFKK